MIKRIGVILIALLFAGSMAWMPLMDSVHAADNKAAVKGCDCGKDCKCEHCKTGKGECSCKGDGKGGCSCGKGCDCGHCKTGKGGCSCKSGSKGCNCKGDAKGGCQCGKDCKCEHCKTGKGECSCKGDGKCGCKCGYCDSDKHGKHSRHGKGCDCKGDAKGGCQCGKDCKCEHCKTGKGECSCKGDGKGCKCGHCDSDKHGKHSRHGKGCDCKGDAKGGCHCGKDCKCEHCKTGKGECSCKGDGKGGCKCGKDCRCAHCSESADADDVKAPAADSDYAKTMTSKSGTFRATYITETDPIAVNKMMTWKLKVETSDGKPVKDAEIKVEGAMPEHGHGLPTDPRVTKNNGDGTYQVEGIKFSMTGWWTMTFTVKTGGKTDSVTFNLRLK